MTFSAYKRILPAFLLCLVIAQRGAAQKDTAVLKGADAAEMDALFSELEDMLDSITRPRSYTSASLLGGNRLLNVHNGTGQATTTQAFFLTPSVGYYHKSGLGIGGNLSLLGRGGQLKPVQYLGTISYDYMKTPGLVAGVAYTRFVRPDSLDFYTSPLKNEVSVYGLYRKSWVKPSLTVSYGWGTKKEVIEQSVLVAALRNKKRKGDPGTIPVTTITNISETVADWMISLSARHDFYYFNVLSGDDHIRCTPQLAFNAGTQRYGFNQSTNSYLMLRSETYNKPFASDQVSLQDVTRLQPLSLTALLRTAYTRRKFFIQPQVIFDYYIPAADHNFTTSFAVNTGFLF